MSVAVYKYYVDVDITTKEKEMIMYSIPVLYDNEEEAISEAFGERERCLEEYGADACINVNVIKAKEDDIEIKDNSVYCKKYEIVFSE